MAEHHVDVLVAGGGVSGALAAVAASREGARVFLVEARGGLGGTGVSALLRHICGLYANGGQASGETLNGGLVREVVAGLAEISPALKATRMGKVYVLPFEGHALSEALNRMCLSSPGLEVLLDASVKDVSCEGGAISKVTIYGGAEESVVFPRAVIDCTGGGEVAFMAGAAFELSPPQQRQPAGYSVRISGARGRDEELALLVPYHLSRAVDNGLFPESFRYTTYTPGSSEGEGVFKFNIAPGHEGEAAASDALRVVRMLFELPEFRGCKITGTSEGVIDREGRRIVGRYTLTEEDVLEARKFPDAAARGAWPIEIWSNKGRPVYKYVREGDYYEIPLRCLRARDIPNLFMAGRCISATHEALGSTRVMGICMALGQSAGRAAALMALGRDNQLSEF